METILCLGASLSYSQDVVPSLEPGSKAVLFSFSGLSLTSTDYKPVVTGIPPLTQSETKNTTGGLTVNGSTYFGGTSIQVFGLAGVEFFLYKELSLSAEYQLGYMSTSRKDQEFTTGGTTTTTKVGSASNIGITNSGVLTLSVYF